MPDRHFRIHSKRLRLNFFIAVLTIGVIGTYLITQSHASTPATSINADSGTVAGNAKVLSDTSASDGRAVGFGMPGTAGATPRIMVLVMENESYSDIIANSSAPYMNSLSHSYQTLTSSYAIAHNSLPNYLALVTGTYYPWSANGAANDDCSPGGSCVIPNGTTTLGDQLDMAGITWVAFMGGMPSNCDTADAGGAGGYVAHHDPFVYETSLAARDCADIQPSGNMIGALNATIPPSFAWYSPTICNDAGGDASCSTIAAGDSHLAAEIPAIQATNWYKGGGLILLTFDEGNDNTGQSGDYGGQVLTILISAKTAGKANSSSYIDSYGLLRSIENAYGLNCLAAACNATSGSVAL